MGGMNHLQDGNGRSNAHAKGGITVPALNSGSSSFKFGLYRVQASSAHASGTESLPIATLLSDSISTPNPQDTIAEIADQLAKAGRPAHRLRRCTCLWRWRSCALQSSAFPDCPT